MKKIKKISKNFCKQPVRMADRMLEYAHSQGWKEGGEHEEHG